jgi:hypothetical protein
MTSTSAFRSVDAGAADEVEAEVDVAAEVSSGPDARQAAARLAGNPRATILTKLRRGTTTMLARLSLHGGR